MDNQSLRYHTGDSSVIKHPIKIFWKVHSYPGVLELPKASKHYWEKKVVVLNALIPSICNKEIVHWKHFKGYTHVRI